MDDGVLFKNFIEFVMLWWCIQYQVFLRCVQSCFLIVVLCLVVVVFCLVIVVFGDKVFCSFNSLWIVDMYLSFFEVGVKEVVCFYGMILNKVCGESVLWCMCKQFGVDNLYVILNKVGDFVRFFVGQDIVGCFVKVIFVCEF